MIRFTIGALLVALNAVGTDGRLQPTEDSRDTGWDAIPALAASVAGPPWISIEYPVNPYDQSAKDAFLLVHAFHHGTEMQFPVSGTAEGLVAGQRRSVSLEFARTSRPGVFALRKQWPNEGVWSLVVTVSQGHNDAATAVVELDAAGAVSAVRVPTRTERGWTIPDKVAMTDVEAGLRARSRGN